MIFSSNSGSEILADGPFISSINVPTAKSRNDLLIIL